MYKDLSVLCLSILLIALASKRANVYLKTHSYLKVNAKLKDLYNVEGGMVGFCSKTPIWSALPLPFPLLVASGFSRVGDWGREEREVTR